MLACLQGSEAVNDILLVGIPPYSGEDLHGQSGGPALRNRSRDHGQPGQPRISDEKGTGHSQCLAGISQFRDAAQTEADFCWVVPVDVLHEK